MVAACFQIRRGILSSRSCRFHHDGQRVGGRVSDRACLTGIIFVLRSGIPWQFALLDWLARGDQIDWSRWRSVVECTFAWLSQFRRLRVAV
jgi:transposase